MFFTYSQYPSTQHKSEKERAEHRGHVQQLSEKLCEYGLSTVLDQYVEDEPPSNWAQWFEDNIEKCDWVLMVFSEAYSAWIKRGGTTNEVGTK